MGAQLLPLTPPPHLRLNRLGTGAALIAAPLFFLADNLLHPEEFERGHEAEQLAAMGDAYTRWQAAHALGFVAILLFAAATLGLAFLVRRRQPRLGLIAGALAVAGLLGLAAVLTIDGYSWAIVAEASRPPEVGADAGAVVLEDLQSSGWSSLGNHEPRGGRERDVLRSRPLAAVEPRRRKDHFSPVSMRWFRGAGAGSRSRACDVRRSVVRRSGASESRRRARRGCRWS